MFNTTAFCITATLLYLSALCQLACGSTFKNFFNLDLAGQRQPRSSRSANQTSKPTSPLQVLEDVLHATSTYGSSRLIAVRSPHTQSFILSPRPQKHSGTPSESMHVCACSACGAGEQQ